MMASLRVQVPDSQSGSRKPLKKAPGLNRAFLEARGRWRGQEKGTQGAQGEKKDVQSK